MKARTKAFAVAVIRFTETLPRGRANDIICRQLIRSATSVGANYRAALQGKSPADFIAKMAIVLEEVDESQYWIEMLIETGAVVKGAGGIDSALPIQQEAKELTAIIASTLKTSRENAARK